MFLIKKLILARKTNKILITLASLEERAGIENYQKLLSILFRTLHPDTVKYSGYAQR